MKFSDSKISIKGISISKEILSKNFPPCNLSVCRHACCRYGALINSVKIKKIKSLLPELFPLMRPEAVKTVIKKGFYLDTLVTGSYMSSKHSHHYLRIVKSRCVFLNYDDQGGCVLQKYCQINNIKYKLKPAVCRTFPFDLIGNRLVVYRWKNLPCLDEAKNKQAPAIYRTCRSELIDFLGPDGYQQLCQKQSETNQ